MQKLSAFYYWLEYMTLGKLVQATCTHIPITEPRSYVEGEVIWITFCSECGKELSRTAPQYYERHRLI